MSIIYYHILICELVKFALCLVLYYTKGRFSGHSYTVLSSPFHCFSPGFCSLLPKNTLTLVIFFFFNTLHSLVQSASHWFTSLWKKLCVKTQLVLILPPASLELFAFRGSSQTGIRDGGTGSPFVFPPICLVEQIFKNAHLLTKLLRPGGKIGLQWGKMSSLIHANTNHCLDQSPFILPHSAWGTW